MNCRTLAAAVREAADWLEWETGSLEDFHAYAQRFKCTAGANVLLFVLEDALRHRGLTLNRFRAEQRERDTSTDPKGVTK